MAVTPRAYGSLTQRSARAGAANESIGQILAEWGQKTTNTRLEKNLKRATRAVEAFDPRLVARSKAVERQGESLDPMFQSIEQQANRVERIGTRYSEQKATLMQAKVLAKANPESDALRLAWRQQRQQFAPVRAAYQGARQQYQQSAAEYQQAVQRYQQYATYLKKGTKQRNKLVERYDAARAAYKAGYFPV